MVGRKEEEEEKKIARNELAFSFTVSQTHSSAVPPAASRI